MGTSCERPIGNKNIKDGYTDLKRPYSGGGRIAKNKKKN